ncbi:glycosyltransferase [Pseudolysinimonas sp.]|uniref:glycosyltransferase n=1 Tax=Pseudolysinimonas sp. TaxID=2680009 RepID=UPI0037832639
MSAGETEIAARITTALDALGIVVASGATPAQRLAEALDADASGSTVWIVLAVLRGVYPHPDEVREARNALVLEGGAHFVAHTLRALKRIVPTSYELLRDAFVVDVFHTAETELATGIQRVVRETVRRWNADRDIVLATWTVDRRGMRRLTAAEEGTALYGDPPSGLAPSAAPLLIPIGGTYVMPELGAEPWRTDKVAAIAEYSSTRTGMIGHDCVPLTSAETTGAGMPAGFARYLSAAARMDLLSVTSGASAIEYEGWRHMLSGIGLAGPEIVKHALACEVGAVSDASVAQFRTRLERPDLPLVVVVGSHEPRKNHLAVLRAAEQVWRRGVEFELLFIGGNSWNSGRFERKVAQLQAAGRPVHTVSAITDAALYAAYVVARVTVYPSLNEGFGLPVAESLLLGTPVITSDFGSMAELARGTGGVLIDPRSADELPVALESLLTDEVRIAALIAESARFVARSWDDYAAETWDFFAGS